MAEVRACHFLSDKLLDMSNGYVQLLNEMFDSGGWGFQEESDGYHRYESFESWASTHVHTVNVSSLDDGAARINSILKNDIPDGNFNIHMFGTSQGGAAILQYFAYTLFASEREERGPGSKYDLDPRIASFVTVDSPMNQVVKYMNRIEGGNFDIGKYNVPTYSGQRLRWKAL